MTLGGLQLSFITKNWGLCKKLPFAIFVSETNLKSPLQYQDRTRKKLRGKEKLKRTRYKKLGRYKKRLETIALNNVI